MNANVKPLHNLVFIKPDEAVETTKGGILLPGSSAEEQNIGVVVAHGPGKRATDTGALIPVTVDIGDRVMFDKGYSRESKLNGEDVIIVSEDYVIAIVNE